MLIGLHRAGHSTKCLGDDAIEKELAPIGIPVEATSQEAGLSAFMADWRSRQNVGPAPFREWASACMPRVRDVVSEWQPDLLLSELFTAEAARLAKLQFHSKHPAKAALFRLMG
jgi:hypothetical protein